MGQGAGDGETATPSRASEWFVALLERPEDAGLRARFETWLAASQARRDDWDEIVRTYRALGETVPVHRSHWSGYAAEYKEERQAPVGRLRRRLSPLVAGIAAAGIAACLAIAAAPGLRLPFTADYASGTAEQRTVRLADGSSVRLGAESALDVDFTADRRRVRLLRGEAFFDIAHDAGRPFSVGTGTITATVLGTAFEVRLSGSTSGVAVRRGRVRVESSGQSVVLPAVLEAGDWLRLDDEGRLLRGRGATDQVAAWTDGRLVARDEPVAMVVERLRHYYSGIVLLRGEALRHEPVTGIYDLDDPLSALRAIAESQGAEVTEVTPWLVIVSGR